MDRKNNIDKQKQNFVQNKKGNALISFLFSIMMLCSICYILYAIVFASNQIHQIEIIISSFFLFLISICIFGNYRAKDIKYKKRWSTLSILSMTLLFTFLILTGLGFIKLPKNTVMKDFTGKSISEALKWADANHIEVEQIYDNNDEMEEYHIIKQSVYPNVLVNKIKTVTFTVSSGPDFNKEVIISDMVGWNVDEVVKVIDEKHLNNVTMNFESNDEITRDIIMEQNKSGNIKRSDELIFKVSLGKKEDLSPTTMINLKDQSSFKATLWLKRNGISYKLNYEFSDTVKRGNVIFQDKKEGTVVNPNSDTVTLTISKGKKIMVPNLTKMSSKQITNWVIENRLKISFTDRYDMKVKQGMVIQANYKENDEIEEGTLIQVTISKGQLKMNQFSTLDEFRVWANRYQVPYREEYETHSNIEKGKIIKFSVNTGDIVNPDETIIIYISSGDTILIPNFIGMNKTDIEKQCKNIGLNCTFSYIGNSSKERDIAISQNKKAGSSVIKDTYVNIGLSSGKTNDNNHVNTGSKPNNNGNNPPSTPVVTPHPTCNNIKKLNLQTGDNGVQTKNMIVQLNPGISFSWNAVNACPNGDSTSGTICSSSKADGTMITSCDTVYITYVN